MALSFDSHPPEVITNAPDFGLLTSLVEDPDHQNLRVRATIYIGGEEDAVAVLENPKGIVDFEMFDLLKSFIGKCNASVGVNDHHIHPSYSSELLTAWDNFQGAWDVFASSGRTITSAVDATGGTALTNDLGSVAVGDIFVVACEEDYLDEGTGDIVITLSNTAVAPQNSAVRYAGLLSGKLQANHIYFLIAPQALSTPAITWIGSGSCEGSGTLSIHKITDFKNSPGLYFHVNFQEVYEDASNVTTIGSTIWSDTLMFIPAVIPPGETFFSDYLSLPTGGKFLSKIYNGAVKYKFGIGAEIRSMYASTSAYVRTNVETDAGITQENRANMGWGMLVLNDSIAGVDAEDETIDFRIFSVTSADGLIGAGPTVTFATEIECFKDIKVLSFVGDLGEEVILFRGLLSEDGGVNKSFFLDQNRIRKVLNAYKNTIMTLRTIYEPEATRRLIHELLYTKFPVWMFDDDLPDNFRDVTVLTDEEAIENQNRLIETEIEVEYYE